MIGQIKPEPVQATDVLLAGDVLRVVHGGLPTLAGADAVARLEELRARYEPFREFLNTPPNGNALVNSCLLYPPGGPTTAGMFFLASRFGFAPIAGTALMAAATVAIAEGRLSADDGWSAVRLDTAVGAAEVQVEIKDGNVIRAKWLRDRPQILVSDQAVACSDAITRSVSLVASGLPYAIVSEDDLGVALDDHARLGPAAAALSADVGAVYPLSRFGLEKEYSRYLVMVVSQPEHNRIRTVWISDKGEVARSAGGTGALAVFAALLARGSSKGEESMLVSAPGGSFLCEARGDSASVTADVRINARHEFYPLPSHLVGT